jgi:hypothetical protein
MSLLTVAAVAEAAVAVPTEMMRPPVLHFMLVLVGPEVFLASPALTLITQGAAGGQHRLVMVGVVLAVVVMVAVQVLVLQMEG